ncbi:hypothetical protein SD51_10645 [Alicyclobacillus tengchongensis]|nr:hypothetical protein SD51_10645 [Alicyclobacillus tengchongensis]
MSVLWLERLRLWWLSCAIVIIIVCVWKEWTGLAHIHFLGYDYAFFYTAFLHVIEGHVTWGTLYSGTSERAFLQTHHYPMDMHNQYVYPPQFAWLFSWLAWLPFAVSLAVWRFLTILCGVFGVFWTAKTLWGRLRRGYLLGLMVAVMTLTPFQLDLAVGNVNTVLFGCFSLAFYLLYRRKLETAAALPIAFAILIKVTPIVILLPLAMQRKWKTIRYTAMFGALIILASWCWLGPGSTFGYAIHFLQFSHDSMQNGPAPYNQSLLGVMELFLIHLKGLYHQPMLQFTFDIYAVAVLAAIVWGIRQAKHTEAHGSVGLTSILPISVSPLLEQPHMVFTLPAMLTGLYMVGRMNVSIKSRYLSIIALAYGLQTLPVTFLLNDLTRRVPSLFWLHTQMFASLVCLIVMLLVLQRPNMLKQVDVSL